MILRAKSGFTRGLRWAVQSKPVVLGRGADCDIVIDDVTVSFRISSQLDISLDTPPLGEATLNPSRTGLSETGIMMAPVIVDTIPAGAVSVANDDKRRPFSDSDLVRLLAMAELAGPFLDVAIRSDLLTAVCERLSQGQDPNSRITRASMAISWLRKRVASLADTERQLKTLAHIEMDHIRYVLDACGGSMKEAASILGVSRSFLYIKVPKHARHQ